MELTNELYNKHKGTIYKAVLKYWKACPNLEFQELISQANLIFCNAAISFDDTKGAKFNTWLTAQLMRLSANIRKEKGINDMNNVRTMKLSLDKEYSEHDNLSEIMTLSSSTEYSSKVSEDSESGFNWEERIPDFEHYFDKMSDDAKQMFNDILDGYLYPDADAASRLGRKAFIETASNINANKMFVRRYGKLGWTIKKVADARNELVIMLRQWKGDKIPSKLKRTCDFIEQPLF